MATSKLSIWNQALSKIGETDFLQSVDETQASAEVCETHWDKVLQECLERADWPWARRQRQLTQVNEQIGTHAGDDTTVNFALPGPFVETTDVEAVLTSGGSDTTWVAGTDYNFNQADGGEYYLVATTPPATGETLTITVTTTRNGWDYIYALPSDFVHAVGLVGEDAHVRRTPVDERIPFDIVPNNAGDGYLLVCDYDTDDFWLEYISNSLAIKAMPAVFEDVLALRLSVELAAGLKKDEDLATRQQRKFELALSLAVAKGKNQTGHSPRQRPGPIRARG